MQDVSISKFEAAEANLLAALHLYFAGEHYAPVHTLAAAANEVIEKLAERYGVSTHLLPKSRIDAAGKEKAKIMIGFLRGPQNFMKHANKENEDSFVFSKGHTEYFLYEASRHLTLVAAHDEKERYTLMNCILPPFYVIYFYCVVLHKEKMRDIVHAANSILNCFPIALSPLPESSERVDWGLWYDENAVNVYNYIKRFASSSQLRHFVERFLQDPEILSLFDEVVAYEKNKQVAP